MLNDHASHSIASTPAISKRGRGRPRKSHKTTQAAPQSDDTIVLAPPSPANIAEPNPSPTRGRPRGSKNKSTLARERRQILDAAAPSTPKTEPATTAASAKKPHANATVNATNPTTTNAQTKFLLHRLAIERVLRHRQALDQELIAIDTSLASLRRRALVRFAPGMLRIPDVNAAMRPLVERMAALEARRSVLGREVERTAERLGALGRVCNEVVVGLRDGREGGDGGGGV